MSTVLDRIPKRMYAQYADKPKFNDWLSIARKMGGDLAEAMVAVAQSYDLDSATGDQLDVIGRIVVLDRGFLNHIEMEPVEFASDADAWEFGDENAVFSEASVADDALMSDGLYRLLIKAKIMKNTGSATHNDIVRQMVQLVGAEFIRINDTDDMSFSVEFSSESITNLQRYALFNAGIIQKPQGVQFLGFYELSNLVEFADDAEAWEFGDENAMFSNITGGQ